MSWRALLESDLISVLGADELSTIRAQAAGQAQADPVPAILLQVANMIQGYIPGPQGAAGTIPERLVDIAVQIIAYRLPLAVRISPTSDRKTSYDDAIRMLQDKVATGKFHCELPVTATTETISAPTIETIRHPQHDHATRDTLAGL
jgi:hypothetical protein